MRLAPDDIHRLAHLARIDIDAGEALDVLAKLDAIFGLIDELQAIDTTGVVPMSHAQDVMLTLLHLIGILVVDLFNSRSRLEVENLFPRLQLNIALKRARPRLRLHGYDRSLLVLIRQRWPNLCACVHCSSL